MGTARSPVVTRLAKPMIKRYFLALSRRAGGTTAQSG